MDYRELGQTGVKVSALCLGTMTFREQNSEAEGHAQMDYAVDQASTSSMRRSSIPSRRSLRPKAAPRPLSAPGSPPEKPGIG